MRSRRTNRWTVAFVAALLCASVVSADPKSKTRKPQQVVPTGAEDSPQAAAPDIAGELRLEQMTNRSDAGLTVVMNADGSESVNLQGRFQNVWLMSPSEDGAHAACFTGEEAKKRLNATPLAIPARPAQYQRIQRLYGKPLTLPPHMLPQPKAPQPLEVM
jgi:hypothetical protein